MDFAPLADLVIYNATVLTMDPLHPYAYGVAVAKGKVIGLLDHHDVTWPLSTRGKAVDAKGSVLMPGLIDAHCHLRAQITQQSSVPCDKDHVGCLEDIIRALKQEADQTPKGNWVRGSGYNPFYLKEKRHPTRWDLDKVSQDHPIRLRHITRHASVLNSAALTLAGIGTETLALPGSSIERDPSGIPTGVIYGADAWLSENVIPPLSTEDLHKGAAQLHTNLLAAGITAVQDATPTNNLFDLSFWSACLQDGWQINIQLMACQENHQQLVSKANPLISAEQSHLLGIGGIKIVMEANPDLFPTLDKLTKMAIQAAANDLPLAMHAVDPEMICAALEAIQAAKAKHPETRTLFRIEHLSLCPDVLLEGLKQSGAIIVTNPGLLYAHGDRYRKDVPPEEHSWLYRMGSLCRAGIALAAGSDAPVASYNPWIGIYSACTRKTESGHTLAPAEKISRMQALTMYTTAAAKAAGWEKERGMLKAGYIADIISLDRNPLTCPKEELKEMAILTTWIAGEEVYKHPYLAEIVKK
ncbi:amidohydrolase [Bacillus testis]|uniref:amidohydrolase n=1 Tax=Bacillus testis TaxID=1622072 RepID=UPI00067F6390|nr:amidohydrolase [Bacillus testis]